MRQRIITWALLGGGAFLFYRFYLTENARNGIKGAVTSFTDAYGKISETLSAITGQVMDDQGLPNREATMMQWERLGY